MTAIRHHLVVAVGLLAVGAVVSWTAALWVAVGLAASLGVHRLATVTAAVDRHAGSAWAFPLLIFFPALSMALVLVAAFVIWRRFGWIAGVAPPVLYLGYFGARP